MKIELNQVYKNFDDGKVKPSRMYDVILTEIIPFDKAPESIKTLWKDEVVICYWLYNKITDYFILGKLDLGQGDLEDVIYVRTLHDGWFSLGEWAGSLDIDGSLEEAMKEYIISWEARL